MSALWSSAPANPPASSTWTHYTGAWKTWTLANSTPQDAGRDAWGFAHHRLKLRVNNVDDAVYFYGNAITCPVMGTFFGANYVCGGVFGQILSQLT